MKKAYWPYLVPFLVFLVLTYAGSWFFKTFQLTRQSLENLRTVDIPDEILKDLQILEGQQFTNESKFLDAVEKQIGKEFTEQYKDSIVKQAEIPYGTYIFYPIKTLIVGIFLYYYYRRKSYPEIIPSFSWVAVFVGILVFIIWVLPEGWYQGIKIEIGPWEFNPFILGSSEFNPYTFGKSWIAYTLIVFRLMGAALVVPIFEELFWRSFAIRWLIKEDFTSVQLGTFTWFSCIVIVLGFGFEHHRWFVGILAGILYNALLYYKKNLSDCILAHAVTNLLLGIYVLVTQQWTFW
jgi:CAAX prenyl protease-like protein